MHCLIWVFQAAGVSAEHVCMDWYMLHALQRWPAAVMQAGFKPLMRKLSMSSGSFYEVHQKLRHTAVLQLKPFWP